MSGEESEDNVLAFTGSTKNDFDPDFVLDAAKGKLEQVTIIGVTKDGNEYFAGSHADAGIALWHLERAKHSLMQIVDAEIGDE